MPDISRGPFILICYRHKNIYFSSPRIISRISRIIWHPTQGDRFCIAKTSNVIFSQIPVYLLVISIICMGIAPQHDRNDIWLKRIGPVLEIRALVAFCGQGPVKRASAPSNGPEMKVVLGVPQLKI